MSAEQRRERGRGREPSGRAGLHLSKMMTSERQIWEAAMLLVRRHGEDAADVAGRRLLGVVPALAVRVPDRVDRRQVDDVEAEPRDFRKARDTIIKRGTFAGLRPLAAWKHFVPGSKARRLAVDDHLQFA